MQLTLGRRWVLELQFSVSLQQRVEAACNSMRVCVQRRFNEREAALKWERAKMNGMMLSSWNRDLDQW